MRVTWLNVTSALCANRCMCASLLIPSAPSSSESLSLSTPPACRAAHAAHGAGTGGVGGGTRPRPAGKSNGSLRCGCLC